MLDYGTLRELETSATSLAEEAGRILLHRFRTPLEVKYKSKDRRDPVTDVDQASEEYLKGEISRRFPEHGIIAEETPAEGDSTSDIVWVVDPLDGTTNYLNGLPVFAVCIGVLVRGRPVVSAVFIPSIRDSQGIVLHARVGGGAYQGQQRIHVSSGDQHGVGRVSALPGSFARAFRSTKALRKRLGEVRVMGSISYEMASVACGVMQYALIGRPRIWDVAGAMVLVREAGGEVLALSQTGDRWRPLDFFGTAEVVPSLHDLRQWEAPLIVANPLLADYLSRHLKRRHNLLGQLPLRLSTLLRGARHRK